MKHKTFRNNHNFVAKNDQSVQSKIKKALRRLLYLLFMVIAFASVYLFLLLGEPDEEAKLAIDEPILPIINPINPMEATDTAGLQQLADVFGEPILSLYTGGELQKARVSDIPFEKNYARMVTLTFSLEDMQIVQLKSIRPKEAAALLSQKNATLYTKSMYSIAGLTASRIDSPLETSIIAQNDNVVYCVIFPTEKQDELTQLLRQTYLISPNTDFMHNQ